MLKTTTVSCGLMRPAAMRTRSACKRGAAFGRGADAFERAEVAHAGDHVGVVDRDGRAAAFAHRAQHQEVADRLRHAQAVGDRVRVFPRRGLFGACVERAHDRRAAGGLHRHHVRALDGSIQPSADISANAFHMPTMPVPPPVG